METNYVEGEDSKAKDATDVTTLLAKELSEPGLLLE